MNKKISLLLILVFVFSVTFAPAAFASQDEYYDALTGMFNEIDFSTENSNFIEEKANKTIESRTKLPAEIAEKIQEEGVSTYNFTKNVFVETFKSKLD